MGSVDRCIIQDRLWWHLSTWRARDNLQILFQQRINQSQVVVVSRMAWYTTGDQSCERVDPMVTMLITCRHCGSPDLTKYGIAPNGKQKYRCRTCGRQSRENPGSASYAPERKEEILRAYQERSCQGSRHRGQKKLTTSWAS